jgi:DICT domain-containing protein
MYHAVTVTPTSLEREMLACYANVAEYGKIEQAILRLAVSAVRHRLEHDPILAERWRKHLEQMADRAARWDRQQAERFACATGRSHDDALTTAGNS